MIVVGTADLKPTASAALTPYGKSCLYAMHGMYCMHGMWHKSVKGLLGSRSSRKSAQEYHMSVLWLLQQTKHRLGVSQELSAVSFEQKYGMSSLKAMIEAQFGSCSSRKSVQECHRSVLGPCSRSNIVCHKAQIG